MEYPKRTFKLLYYCINLKLAYQLHGKLNEKYKALDYLIEK